MALDSIPIALAAIRWRTGALRVKSFCIQITFKFQLHTAKAMLSMFLLLHTLKN